MIGLAFVVERITPSLPSHTIHTCPALSNKAPDDSRRASTLRSSTLIASVYLVAAWTAHPSVPRPRTAGMLRYGRRPSAARSNKLVREKHTPAIPSVKRRSYVCSDRHRQVPTFADRGWVRICNTATLPFARVLRAKRSPLLTRGRLDPGSVALIRQRRGNKNVHA